MSAVRGLAESTDHPPARLLDRLRRLLPGLARSNPCDPHGRSRVSGRAIYILPTGAGLLFSAILFLMLAGALNYQNNLGLLFTFLTASVALVAMHHTWFNLLGLVVTSRGGGAVFCGDATWFRVGITNPGERRRSALTASRGDEVGGPADIPPGGEGAMRIRVHARGRGTLALGPISLETRFPLGLFRAWCTVETGATVMVYPRPAERSPPPPSLPAHRHNAGGDRGVGADDFRGLRGYREGDSPRQLDWKAYGRGRGLMVKQFGGDRADQVLVDWDQFPGTELEARLSLLCRQVIDAASSGQTFGLRLPGTEVGMGLGEAHKHRCLEALARFGQD